MIYKDVLIVLLVYYLIPAGCFVAVAFDLVLTSREGRSNVYAVLYLVIVMYYYIIQIHLYRDVFYGGLLTYLVLKLLVRQVFEFTDPNADGYILVLESSLIFFLYYCFLDQQFGIPFCDEFKSLYYQSFIQDENLVKWLIEAIDWRNPTVITFRRFELIVLLGDFMNYFFSLMDYWASIDMQITSDGSYNELVKRRAILANDYQRLQNNISVLIDLYFKSHDVVNFDHIGHLKSLRRLMEEKFYYLDTVIENALLKYEEERSSSK